MTADGQAPLHNEIILYATPDGAVRVEVVFEGETFWLTQRRMADLFGVGVPTIMRTPQQAGSYSQQLAWFAPELAAGMDSCPYPAAAAFVRCGTAADGGRR